MITGRASSTFELYLIKNKEMEDYELGANLSEPEYYRELDAFEDVCELYDEIAEELLKDCKGQKKYTIRADFVYETIDCGPDGIDHDLDYTYEVLSVEPSTYFWDIERKVIREDFAKQSKEAFENGEFIVNASAYGIKCDNEDCGWADWSVTADKYFEYIDKPCPCCGENLLTKEAFDQVKKTYAYAEDINNMFFALPKDKQDNLRKSGYASASYPVNADGTFDVDKMKIEIMEDDEREV